MLEKCFSIDDKISNYCTPTAYVGHILMFIACFVYNKLNKVASNLSMDFAVGPILAIIYRPTG